MRPPASPSGSIGPTYRRAVSAAVLRFVAAGFAMTHQYTVAVKPQFRTAAWAYLPPHRVWLGDQMLGQARAGLSCAEIERYAAAFVCHEFSHMQWTTREMRGLADKLRERSIPFDLFNLFEDARIEELFRARVGQRFEWLAFEEAKVPQTPSGLLFAMIQAEGPFAVPAGPPGREPTSEDRLWSLAPVVSAFYAEILGCSTSEDLVPLLERWVREFPEDARAARADSCGSGGRGRSGTTGDGADAVPIHGDATLALLEPTELAAAVQALCGDAVALTDADAEAGPGKRSTGGRSTGERVELQEAGNGAVLGPEHRDNGYSGGQRAQVVAATLSRALLRPAGVVCTEEPGKRVDIRSAACAATAGWRYRHRIAARPRRYPLALVLDCSGSMSGAPMAEGLVLVDALSELALRGAVEGCLILSSVQGRRALWQRFRLPVPLAVLRRVIAVGEAEGLQAALIANRSVLSSMAQVLVFTDADICDQPLDRKALAATGIRPIGLYVGDASAASSMATHFAESLIRPSVEALAEAIVARYKARRR